MLHVCMYSITYVYIHSYIKLGNTDGHTRAGSEGRTQRRLTVKVNQREEETKMCALQIKSTQGQQKVS